MKGSTLDKPANASFSDSDNESDDEVESAELTQRRAAKPRERAQAISAEADGVDPNFQPPQYPKTEGEMVTLKKILLKSFLFANLDSEDTKKVLLAFRRLEVPDGDYLINQGEDGNHLYVVESGKFDVWKKMKSDKEPKKVNEMCAGSTVGELALLYCTPRAASVVANGKCVVHELDRPTFNNIVKVSAMNKRRRLLEILKKIPLLVNCDAQQLVQLADAATTCECAAGECVVEQGGVGDAFFILLKGSADVLKNGSVVLRYTDGDFFGELALLNKAPRAASVVATCFSTFIRFDVASFNRVLEPLQGEISKAQLDYSDIPIDQR